MNLTPEQIRNWRNVLSTQLGPYAFIMPVEQIEKFRDRLQGHVNQLDKGATNEQNIQP